jgi:uncharacterized protein YndB with AHSA1/START domain
MADIRHRIGITAPLEEVYGALATADGVRSWWTRDARGKDGLGERLALYFGGAEASAVLEVTDLDGGSRVGWRFVDGPAEWIGTSVKFDLRAEGDETVILFTHADWREPAEFMHHCSSKWALFLFGLKAGLEGGSATPHPEDARISNWG